MNSRSTRTKLLLIMILVMAWITPGYSRQTRTFSQPEPEVGAILVPSDYDVVDTNHYAEATVPGIGSIAPPFPKPSAGWPWLLLGLLTGWVVGSWIRRDRRQKVVLEEVPVPKKVEVTIPRDRAA